MGAGLSTQVQACSAGEPQQVIKDAQWVVNNPGGAITREMAQRGLPRLGDNERAVRHVTNVVNCVAQKVAAEGAADPNVNGALDKAVNAERIAKAGETYTRAVKVEYDK